MPTGYNQEDRCAYLPTEEEIAQLTATIRQGWEPNRWITSAKWALPQKIRLVPIPVPLDLVSTINDNSV